MFTTRQEARKFALGGNARITAVSKATGARFTFRLRRPSEDKPTFVQVLTGSDNESSYTFLGTIFADGSFRYSPKSAIGPDAPSAKAFPWVWNQIQTDGDLPETLDLHHEGRCGRCGRALTVPESIESGFGPECINHVH
jgi:hypothetical protein